MTVYWLLYLLPAWMALATKPKASFSWMSYAKIRFNGAAVLALIFVFLIVALRYDTGGDWVNYVRHQVIAQQLTLPEVVFRGDPAYWAISTISAQLGFGIVGVNIFSGAVFSIGLFVFCHSLPRPWLALAVSVPYLVIVVGMGYVRQSVALAFFMIGLVAMSRQSFRWFVIWVLIGATFHKSAIAMIPLAALSGARNRFMTALFGAAFFVVGYYAFLEDAVDDVVQNYVVAQYQSAGALVRLALNFVPAAIFLIMRSRFPINSGIKRLYSVYALASVGIFLGFFATSASTILDRFGLYMIPLQLFVFSYLPDVIGKRGGSNLPLVLSILAFYALVLFVWLNFADNAFMWLPYRSYLFL